MGDKKNLEAQNAVSKMQELVKELRTCMFGTYTKGELCLRPMSTQQADEEGNIWFLSDKGSDKNQQIAEDARVELIYGKGNEKYLFVHGNATVSRDKQKIKELWEPLAKIWFTEGEDDPRISVIKVAFHHGYYWDIKHGKMVELAKMAASLVTGKTMDDGIEGNLNK
jgi:general stress protein 26